MAKNWQEMTPQERWDQNFSIFVSPPGVQFASPKAKKQFEERANMIKDAIELKKKPARVPVTPSPGLFPAYYAGYNIRDILYDYEKLRKCWVKFHQDFDPDVYNGPIAAVPGKCFDILDYKLYLWPGHGVSDDRMYQTVEGEYVTADEYDALSVDPTDFFQKVYLPRVFAALEPLKKLPLFPAIQEMPMTGTSLLAFGMPDVQAALKKLMEAGEEALRWIAAVGAAGAQMTTEGYPGFSGGVAKAPFDAIGDTLRGTRGLMMDLYRRPEKVLEACERFAPLMIRMGVEGALANGNPLIFIPLHKGADGFMSDAQFKKFYWPTLKKVCLGLIAQGCVPQLFAEGGYDTRLEFVADELPYGKVIWWFDQSDMQRAYKLLKGKACIAGNVPGALMAAGTPQDIKDYCKKLIDTVGRDGGFILTNGVGIDHAKPENVRTMIEFSREYGVYK